MMPALFGDLTRPARKRRTVPPSPEKRGPKTGNPPPAPLLSPEATTFYEQLVEKGRMGVPEVRQLLGTRADAVLRELQFLVLCLPGGDGTRDGRSGSYVPRPPVPTPTSLEIDMVYSLLRGKSGTLGGLARLIGWPQPETLAALCALQEQGRAQGAGVGATVAFRILPETLRPSSPSRRERQGAREVNP
ncbi:hypothetical protein DVJ83_18855 (plasmid) [Deinococcus wulumuqiensis]|uniref:Uncharacterized protein n=1 Tax=Deinococcus wulumuqiensis TaxID=980427 RepID=A0A345IN56_9DEIO|nr:hypothetical protein [Deinococcus wulumuqiensis]AXH01129.1 hypothetical protein DVJ83_18855 [Deinococcus wulumuqiensis]